MKRKTKLMLGVVLGLVIVVGALAGVKAGQIVTMVRASESFAPPPEAVTSAKAEPAEWEGAQAAIGSLVAVRGVTLGAELAGRVTEIAIEAGTVVRKGA